MTAITLASSSFKSLAQAIPRLADMDVLLWPVLKAS
jgi:hypothetical protein